MEPHNITKRNRRVKLIFNPKSGENGESPEQLMAVIKAMQAWKLVAEPYLIEPDCNLASVVGDAISRGIKMIVVCGGDGTISAAVKAMMGTNATLGIIPTGTQNNVARSLGIPTDIPTAVAMLRMGKRHKLDVGIATCNEVSTPFIEICSVGLFSTLFPAGDDIQHGDITRIGDFLTILTKSPPSQINLIIDDEHKIKKPGHVVLVSNMRYFGHHYQINPSKSFGDGFLDVLFCPEISKMDLVGHAINGSKMSTIEDGRIKKFRVHQIEINTEPKMPIMADGIAIGKGSVQIEIKRQALTVMVGLRAINEQNEKGEMNEK